MDRFLRTSLAALLLSFSLGAPGQGNRENLPWVDISQDTTRQKH